MEPIHVLCVDDNADVLAVVSMLVDHAPGLSCVGSLETANNLKAEAIDRNADVVLLDLRIPGCDSLARLRELTDSVSTARTIVLSGDSDDDTVDRSIAAGAVMCLRKDGDPRVLIDTIRKVAAAGRN